MAAEEKPKFRRIDEGIYADEGGTVYEDRGGKMIPTGGKVEDASTSLVAAPPAPSPLLVLPEVSIEQAKKVWEAYQDFRSFILKDPACYDEIEGSKEMNRTGATRLAVPFGLSIQQDGMDEERLGDDARFVVHVRVGKGDRWVGGIGLCRLSEIAEKTKKGQPVPLGQREHFALARAWTRAVKRGIADILGGTEAD